MSLLNLKKDVTNRLQTLMTWVLNREAPQGLFCADRGKGVLLTYNQI